MIDLKVKELSFKYKQQTILDEVSILCKQGLIHGIIGPNGSGKTTLLRNILKLVNLPIDTVFLSKEDISTIEVDELARQVSYVPQATGAMIDFTLEEIVSMGRHPFMGRFASETLEDKVLVKEALEITDLLHLKDRKFFEVSGGERQRATIARALAQTPKIMVMDEPLANLDIAHQIEIIQLLHRLKQEKGLTVIIVLHDINIALQYCDNLILLKDGNIIDQGDSQAILNRQSLENVYEVDFFKVKHEAFQQEYLIPKVKF